MAIISAARRPARPVAAPVGPDVVQMELTPANDSDIAAIRYPTTVRYVIVSPSLEDMRPEGTTLLDSINRRMFDLAMDPARADRYADVVGKGGLVLGLLGLGYMIARSVQPVLALLAS